MIDHDQIESSVAAFVLDACEDPEERRLLRAHVEGCASCRELAGRLARVTGQLALAVEDARPPDRLRRRILEAAAASPRAAPSAAEGPAPERRTPVLAPRRRRGSGGDSWAASWRRQLGVGGVRFPGYAAAMAVLTVALLGLGAWNVSLNQGPAQYSIAGTGAMAGSSGSVTAFRRDGITLVAFHGMPQPVEGRVYELWLIGADGKPIPGPVFTPDRNGGAQLILNRDLQGVRTLAVTVEAGPDGVSAPTQKPELAGQIG